MHFDPYLNHPVIRLAKVIRDSFGLGYDAVMAMAVHLSPPPELLPLLPFTDSIPDHRWGSMANEFADQLRAFFADAHCAEFFGQVQPLYDAALGRYRTIFDKLDLNWYKLFYGRTPTTTFHVVLGMGNGGGNFGPRIIYPGGREDVYAIEGVGQPPMLELGVQVNRRGFFWLRGLVALLGRYESERTTFPTLESFMPEIVRFYDTLVPDIAAYHRRLADSSIPVVQMGPFQSGDTNVAPGIREISFTFDRPFFEGHYQFGPSSKGAPEYDFVGVSYSPDHKTIVLKANLKPGVLYEMYTGGSFFISMDGYPAKRFEFTFRTGAK